MAIVRIFDASAKMLCIGVLLPAGFALTHKNCLGTVIDPIIKFPGNNKSHNTLELRFYNDVARIEVSREKIPLYS